METHNRPGRQRMKHRGENMGTGKGATERDGTRERDTEGDT